MTSLSDVKPDGNCGFCVAAKYLDGNKDNWVSMRVLLIEQFKLHIDRYADMFSCRTKKAQKAFIGTIAHDGITFPPKSKWFTTPEMTQLLADTTNLVVVVLSSKLEYYCQTYIPMVGNPDTTKNSIVMLHENEVHWLLGNMDNTYLPPMALNWKSCIEMKVNKEVLNFLQPKFEKWRKRVPFRHSTY